MSYDIRNCRVGFVAYQKKPEFGPARMQVHEFGVLQVERPFLVEERSQILRGSHEMPVTGKNIAGLLYGAVYGKASR